MAMVGYTAGVFDLFHIGHLNILRRARSSCDYLIVGVTTDELSRSGKGVNPVVPFSERVEIIRAVRYVDEVVPQDSYDKVTAWKTLGFNKIYVGSDWKDTAVWAALEQELLTHNVKVVYLPYTQNTSSTKLRAFLDSYRADMKHVRQEWNEE